MNNPDDDNVVVAMTITKHPIKRILVDNGSSIDVLSYEAFVQMSLSPGLLRPVTTPLMGFTGDSVRVGEVTLSVTAGTEPHQSTVFIKFLAVRVPLAYNTILERLGLNLLYVVISTKRLLVRFSIIEGVGEMHGKQNPIPLCYHTALSPQETAPLTPEPLDPRDSEKRGEPAEHLLTFPLEEDPTRTVRVGALLSVKARDRLLAFLWTNADIFAWSASDMPSVPSEVITNKLSIDPKCRPVRQKKRSFAPERQRAVDEEVHKLVAAGHIREAYYPVWLANMVMVRKANGS